MPDWKFACPRCHTGLTAVSPHTLTCPQDNFTYIRQEDIWRLLLPDRMLHFQQFVADYEAVRQVEGWGGQDANYYRALPQVPPDDPNAAIWHIRTHTFQAFRSQVLPRAKALKIVDLGAGNGWLANRLTQFGHHVAAVDLLTNPVDGLGACQHYDETFTAVQAEFDHLPFCDNQVDLAIFNGSFHYATNYDQTLQAALRVLRPNGRIVIMDSPIYHDSRSGQQMVQERLADFAQRYGRQEDALAHESFLTFGRLAQLAQTHSINWHYIRPHYGWCWAMRPWLARLRRHREPATFLLLVGERL